MIHRLLVVLLAALSRPIVDADLARASDLVWPAIAASCSEASCDVRMASILVATGAGETRGKAATVPDRGGRAAGRYQLHAEWWQGHRPEELNADPYLDARLARDAIRVLERHCGSLRRGLGAYASGSCSGGEAYASSRCALAGGCED